MDTKFEYFHWAVPKPDQPLYALYDVFDNHFMMQHYSYEHLFTVRKLFKSKTTLDIVRLSDIPGLVDKNLIDNSVIEKWGIANPITEFFTDGRPSWSGHTDAEAYYQVHIAQSNIQLTQSQVVFDDFKFDLQKQLFFVHHCLTFDLKPTVLSHLATAVSLGINHDDVVNRFLDLTTIVDRQIMHDTIDFLKVSCLFYE